MLRTRILTTLTLIALMLYSCSGSGSKEDSAAEATGEESPSEESPAASVYFISPEDGDSVLSPLVIEMGVEGMVIDPAGEIKEGMGHHHLIINGSYIEEGTVVPTDPTHIHYGLGQTSDTIELAPGNYRLTLQFADGVHQSFGEPLSSSINVVVKENE